MVGAHLSICELVVSVFVSVCGVSAGSEGVGVTYFTSDRESPVLRSPDHNNLTKEEDDAHREQKVSIVQK